MRRIPEVLRFIRWTSVLLLVVFAFSCNPATSSAPATDGDFIRAMSIGAANEDIGYGVCVDSSGNVYTTGSFNGIVDFDPGTGVYELDSEGTPTITNAVFVSKLDSNGDLVWAKAISDTYACIGYGITVDSSGNVFVTGFFWDTVDFNPGAGTDNLVSAGQSDVFVLKLDSSGNYVWASSMGGTQHESGLGITLNNSGEILLTGFFEGTADFDPGASTSNLTSDGNLDIFICKLDSSGNYVWAKGIGGTAEDRGLGIDTDTSGNVYTTGFFQNTADFDPGAGTSDMTSIAGYDAFISKLDSSGNFVWAKQIGGAMEDEGHGIAVDGLGNIYTTGCFRVTVDFDPGISTSNLISDSGSQDVFVSKLSSGGNYVWAGAMGGSLNDQGMGISVDTSGNVFTTGFFQDTGDFDPGPGTYNLTHNTINDIFVSKLDSDGDFVWAKAMSGSSDERGNGLCVDSSSNVFITGTFIDIVDFDPGSGIFDIASASGSKDIFIAYIDGP